MRDIDQFLIFGIIGIIAIFSFGSYSHEKNKDFIRCIEVIGNENVAVLKNKKQIRYFEKDSSGNFVSTDANKDIIEFTDKDKTVMRLSGEETKFYVKTDLHENVYTLKNDITK